MAAYEAAFAQYGYFASAARGVDPAMEFTTAAFAGTGNGLPAPAAPTFDALTVLHSYDVDRTNAVRPMENVALADRLRSRYPDRPAWALLDDFFLKFGRETRQRQWALSLTRGPAAVGSNWVAQPAGPFARKVVVDAQRDLNLWVRKYGGAYAMTRPLAHVGVLYVHEQAAVAPPAPAGADDAALTAGPHGAKVTEALWLCHAAGWPAKVVTPDELRRGLPPEMTALLLVGLTHVDDSWHWYDGLEPHLKAFAGRGGRILLDERSVCPVPSVQTGIVSYAFVPPAADDVPQKFDQDHTPRLLRRNAPNIEKLRAAMEGAPPPLAASKSETLWAVPAVAGDVQYVTVVTWAWPEARTGTRVMRPQSGPLAWHTDRPIYDVRLGRRVTPEEAASVELSGYGFRWYALPPAEPTAPAVTVAPGPDGFYTATVALTDQPTRGVPVQLSLRNGNDTATVFSASGLTAKLPVTALLPGRYTLTATELLTNKGSDVQFDVAGGAPPAPPKLPGQVAAFLARRHVPLTIALTPQQAADDATRAVAERLRERLAAKGRTATLRTIAPGDVVTSLQPVAAVQRFPQWHTIGSDLVLLGTPGTNVLLLDQARGFLLPATGAVAVTHSPFVGEFDALNLIGPDPAALTAAADAALK